MPLTIERVETATDEICQLISELDVELSGTYTAEQNHGLSVAQLFRPGILFFIARLDGQPVGCGGIALEDGFAEVKRMYVRPTARGRNVATAILEVLQEQAKARGIGRLVLETGDIRAAAIRLYERFGYTRCPAFGAYVRMPQSAIAHSVFFEKRIDA